MHNSHDSSHVRLPLFDAHAHLVADDQTRYPRKPMQRAPNAPPRKPGVIGTPGGKAGPNPVNEIPDVLRMVRWMKEENVEGGVAVQKRMLYRFDNSYILDSSDLYPEVFSAVVILDAEDAGTPALIRQYREQHGLSGVRLFGGREPDGTMPWLNSPSALETWAVANAYGLVMNVEVLATGGGGPSVPAIIELARRFPNVRVVLDHMLEPEVEDDNYGFDARFVPLSASRTSTSSSPRSISTSTASQMFPQKKRYAWLSICLVLTGSCGARISALHRAHTRKWCNACLMRRDC